MVVIERAPGIAGIPLSRNGHKVPHRKPWLVWASLAAAALLLLLGILWIVHARTAAQTAYVTQPAARQTLVQTVTATGTVNPQDTISVGTQVSGTISQLDVDFNSKVHKGQLLATIDPTPFQAALDQAQATLSQTQAQADAAQANAAGSSQTAA